MREIEGERLIMGRPFSRPTSTIEAYQPSINYVDINYETLRYARADLTGGDVICRGIERGRKGMSVLSLRAKGSFNMNCVLITEKLGARNAPPLIIIYLGD